MAAIANLKGAAQDAVERLDLEQVEVLLARVDQVETEILAETKEARARNALLRNLPYQAYRLLSAAADAFLSIDEWEPARRRLEYEDQLFQHGRRYSSIGLKLSERMIRAAIGVLTEERHPELWGRAQNALAITLSAQGERVAGMASEELLKLAIETFKISMKVRNKDTRPLQWAATMQNIANAYRHLGQRADGNMAEAFFAQSVEKLPRCS